eukprot:gene522-2734_t
MGISPRLQRWTNGHADVALDLTDGSDRVFQLRAEVARINRNIVIEGIDPDIDDSGELCGGVPCGGHFIIAHSDGAQIVDGVEFTRMGRAGQLGKYPLHMHWGGYVDPASRFSRNSIHHCQQRCIVVHASHDLLVEHNAAYLTKGTAT